jgi:hypothetical protein
MKEHILFIILLVAGIGAGFYAGMYIGKDETEDRYAAAPHRRDTNTTIQQTPQPERRVEIKNPPRVTPQHRINADSVFEAGWGRGYDEAQRIFAELTAPEDTTVIFDSIGVLRHTFDPLTRMAYYNFYPAPIKTITTVITDSIFVPTEEARPWWHTPAYIIGGIAIGYLTNDILKK